MRFCSRELANALVIVAFAATANAAWAECPSIPIDYSASCGETENLHSLRRLEDAGQCVTIEVDSRSRWNPSGLLLEGGVTYEFVVPGTTSGDQFWCDASIRSGPAGFSIPEEAGPSPLVQCEDATKPVEFGVVQLFVLEMGRDLSRRSSERLFTLIGETSEPDAKRFAIGEGTQYSPENDGEFCSFANDWTFTYGNNSGSLRVEIWRLPE